MAITNYSYNTADFPNQLIHTTALTKEIQNSAIVIELSHINTDSEENICDIRFLNELSTNEEIILDNLVATHSGIYTESVAIPITVSAPTPDDVVWADTTTGVLYMYDSDKNTWLSNQRNSLIFFRKGNTKNMYLPLSGDLDYVLMSHITGKPSKLLGVFCKSESGNVVQGFEIRKNGSTLFEFSYPGTGVLIYSNYNLNFNVEIDDKLQIYVKEGSNIFNTFCRLDLAWRYDV